MSSTRTTSVAAPPGGTDAVGTRRRVRHQARDALAVMTFSLASSAGFALLLLVVTVLLHPGR